MKFRARAAYDGTEFYGFQRQSSFRSVQGEIETALQKITNSPQGVIHVVHGAGRTDTGVHATGQVISFDLVWGHSLDALNRALNVNLPADVAIDKLETVAEAFSPRFDARSRTYEYTVYVSPVRQPLRDRYAWHIESVLDVDAMNEAARGLLGEHDFAAFGSPTSDTKNTVRQVIRAGWSAGSQNTWVFTIEANAFLYRMVRRIVNALVKVGRSRLTKADVAEALASRDQDRITGLAPACGLCLVDVKYALDSTVESSFDRSIQGQSGVR
jgi:tRNA pseudouridine38-40 synthase